MYSVHTAGAVDGRNFPEPCSKGCEGTQYGAVKTLVSLKQTKTVVVYHRSEVLMQRQCPWVASSHCGMWEPASVFLSAALFCRWGGWRQGQGTWLPLQHHTSHITLLAASGPSWVPVPALGRGRIARPKKPMWGQQELFFSRLLSRIVFSQIAMVWS